MLCGRRTNVSWCTIFMALLCYSCFVLLAKPELGIWLCAGQINFPQHGTGHIPSLSVSISDDTISDVYSHCCYYLKYSMITGTTTRWEHRFAEHRSHCYTVLQRNPFPHLITLRNTRAHNPRMTCVCIWDHLNSSYHSQAHVTANSTSSAWCI